MKVLIVDDEEHIRKKLGAALEAKGCDISDASSVGDARKLLSDSKFDYAIIDMKLDVTSEYGGIEIFRLAKQSAVNSIILSAYSFEEVTEQLKRQSSSNREAEKTLREIESNYIDKASEINYIEAVINRLGIEDAPSTWYGKYYALLIAVQDYGKSGISNLNYPINDAEKLCNILNKYYNFNENSTNILRNPTRQEILMELYEVGKKLTSKDNLLIFYAGHGCWDKDREQGYWLPRNSAYDNPSNWVSNGDLRDFIRGIKTQHTLLISDACFSGAIFKSRSTSDFSKTIQEKYRTPSRRAITSSDAVQTVPDQSIFLDYLVDILRNSSGQYLYSEKLYVSICDRFVSNNLSEQNPVYGRIENTGDKIGGDFVFVRR